jgi:hypothetical protein
LKSSNLECRLSYETSNTAEYFIDAKNRNRVFEAQLKYLRTRLVTEAARTFSEPACMHGIEFLALTRLNAMKELRVKY